MAITKITLQNDDLTQSKVSGAIVSVYNTGGIFQTSGSTSSLGEVQFTLPDATYDLLFFKVGFSTIQPQRIVVDSLLTNNFLIIGHTRIQPESLDPTLCRVSGYINGIDGKPVKDIDVRFDQLPINIISNRQQIFNSPVQYKSNDSGYFEFDLLRNIKYEAGIDGYPYALLTRVADVPAVKLSDLLFPLPVLLTLSTATISTSRGAPNSSITYTALYSDFNTNMLTNDWSGIEVDYSLPGICTLGANETNLIITPIATGTTVITFTRVINPKFVWINPPIFTAPTLTVTVS